MCLSVTFTGSGQGKSQLGVIAGKMLVDLEEYWRTHSPCPVRCMLEGIAMASGNGHRYTQDEIDEKLERARAEKKQLIADGIIITGRQMD